MFFLNSGMGLKLFEKEAYKRFYVDKSLMIDVLYRYLKETNGYVCVTRPRRFGKTVCANMVSAFFDRSTAGLYLVILQSGPAPELR